MRPLVFAIAWAVLICLTETALTFWRGEALTGRSAAVVAVFTVSAFLGAFCAWGTASLMTFRRRKGRLPARFAAMILSLTLGTAGFCAVFFFLQLRAYYSQWHTSTISMEMFWQFAFTGASTSYIFAVMGARPLLPFVFLPMLAFSWYFARIEPSARV